MFQKQKIGTVTDWKDAKHLDLTHVNFSKERRHSRELEERDKEFTLE